MPFEQIIDAVQKEMVEAGLLIHEGSSSSPSWVYTGYSTWVSGGKNRRIATPTRWNAVRRALGPEVGRKSPRRFATAFPTARPPRRSLELRHAIRPARWTPNWPTNFVGMYVNNLTLSYGEKGKQAVRELMRAAPRLAFFLALRCRVPERIAISSPLPSQA